MAATTALAASSVYAAVLVVAEARGIAFKPGDTLDAAKPLVLKQGQHLTLISEYRIDPEAGWTL